MKFFGKIIAAAAMFVVSAGIAHVEDLAAQELNVYSYP